ncbi:hypothetical protein BpHYR1_047357 [Brachionus plicatilis]|uniref:EB domain-containing protein n=1 Tax=Brachionus plicatilis TaxID=10195 RepID=A0A3M7RUL3_BRAPC|nr:hypothetical protein BpHYR1_047357 [Brachionus plicatilis]
MCLDPMTCVANKCICGENEYFENITSSCIPKLIYGFSCNSDSECRSDLNLICVNNQCVCNSLDRTWSYLSNNCLLTYSKGHCSLDSECNTDQKLICQSYSIQNCSCPQLSQQWVCDCNRTIDNEKYWNGKECIEANTFGRNCTENYHCQTITENTICDQNICKCADSFKIILN